MLKNSVIADSGYPGYYNRGMAAMLNSPPPRRGGRKKKVMAEKPILFSTTDDETKLQDEAEKLYPYPNRNDFEYEIDFATQQIKMDKQRSAYISGRRVSLSTLKEKEKEIADLKDRLKKTEEISRIATEGLREAEELKAHLELLLKHA